MFSILTILIVCALSVAAGFSVYLSARPVTTPYAHSVDERVERDAAALATRKRHSQRATTLALSAVIVAVAGVILNPYVRVWTYGMDGQAQMAQAESSRQIKVREAQATRDAALLLAEAEVARAKGVAEANRIVADGLGGPEGYLRYLYIEGLKEAREKGNAQVIYVATEAGLPILESTRLNHTGSKQ